MCKPIDFLVLPYALFAALLLGGCGGGGGNGQGDGTGTLSVGITDAGAEEVEQVWVRFTGVTVKPKNGGQEYFAIDPIAPDSGPGRIVDLMSLTGTAYEQLLEDQVLPAGEYNWIRLEIEPNDPGQMNNLYVMTHIGETMELEIPSGLQSGLKLVSGFTVLANRRTDFMIDWDLKKALVMPRNGQEVWKLRPALRITDLAEYGRIEGAVSQDLFDLTDRCAYDFNEDLGNAVYAFRVPEGNTPLAERFQAVMEDDIDDDDTDGEKPYATAVVKFDGVNDYRYAFDYMGLGDYKLAFTCEAARDEADFNDTDTDLDTDELSVDGDPVEFTVYADPVTVTEGQTTEANF